MPENINQSHQGKLWVSNAYANTNKPQERKKYCIMYDSYINKCESVNCNFYPCSFSDLHKVMCSMFKDVYELKSDDARNISRTLLLNTFNPKTNVVHKNNKKTNIVDEFLYGV